LLGANKVANKPADRSTGSDRATRIHVLMNRTNNASNKTIMVRLGGVIPNSGVDTTPASLDLEMCKANRARRTARYRSRSVEIRFGCRRLPRWIRL